jgi:hypothetical protein
VDGYCSNLAGAAGPSDLGRRIPGQAFEARQVFLATSLSYQ